MPRWRTILLTCVVALYGFGTEAEAQYRGGGYGYAQRNRQYAGTGLGRIQIRNQAMLGGLRGRATFRTGTGAKRYAGTQTRVDRLRSSSPFTSRNESLLPSPPPSYSPIRVTMERRNLLRSRSNLGSRISLLIGRNDYLREAGGQRRGDIRDWPGVSSLYHSSPIAQRSPSAGAEARVPTPTSTSTTEPSPSSEQPGGVGDYQDQLVSRLRTRADDYFELGASYLRHDEPIAVANCFEIVRGLESKGTRGLVADVFAAVRGESYNRAMTSLLKAIENAQSLDDLQIDQFIDFLYPGEDAATRRSNFRRMADTLTAQANLNPESALANLLMAYFSWLNGNIGTAITATENAERNLDATHVPHVQKFRQFLTEAREGRPAA